MYLFHEYLVSFLHFQTVLANAKKLLAKEVLSVLDGVATEVFSSRQVKMFPYCTLRETLNLVMVTLLRELLAYQKGKNVRPIFQSIIYLLLLK